MEIKKIDEKELVISQRKKRNRDSKKTIVSAFKLSFCITNEVFFSNDFSGSLAAEMESVSLMNESLPTPFILMVSVSV